METKGSPNKGNQRPYVGLRANNQKSHKMSGQKVVLIPAVVMGRASVKVWGVLWEQGDVIGKSTTTPDEHTEYTGVYFLKNGPARCLLSLTEG